MRPCFDTIVDVVLFNLRATSKVVDGVKVVLFFVVLFSSDCYLVLILL